MRAMLFAHYTAGAAVAEWKINALNAYRSYFDVLVLVSTSALSPADRRLLNSICDEVIERENVGYDFCSWKAGIEALGRLDRFDAIVVANDSVIGPLSDTGDLFTQLWADPRDICGLTLNWEFERHIQSYFMRFGPAPIKSGAFEDFWRSVDVLTNKQEVIERFEVGLTRFMESRGHSTGALYEPPAQASLFLRLTLAARNASITKPIASLRWLRRVLRADHLNPTHYLWREILNNGIPFVKKELIRDNPVCQNMAPIYNQVERRFGLTRTELDRRARNDAV